MIRCVYWIRGAPDQPDGAARREIHRRSAARIRRDPGAVAETRERRLKVMAAEAPYVDPVLREWLDVLLMLAPDQITRDRELVMIGSQAIHAITNDVPDEVLISRECDVLLAPR